MSIRKFFDAAVKFHASDLFISSGKAPGFRVNGSISLADNIPPVTPETITEFRKSCLSASAENQYSATGGAECSLSNSGHRVRLNFYESGKGP
ncbi:MAG: hypothetical protein J6S43_01585, partial [Lentisphaeria bacterium]|nr:hypothetical protein [Lentisphaeria bacterium]